MKSKCNPQEVCECSCACEMNRRDMMVTGTAAAFTLALGAESGEVQASETPDKMPIQPGDRFELIKGEMKGELLKPEMLTSGDKPIEAFPFDPKAAIIRRKNRLNRLLVLKLDPSEMDDDTKAREVEGVLAYSAICTHRGCTIKSWKAEEKILRCHCHLSEFNPLSAGSVISGPARRHLAMVPLELDDDGYVIAASGFTGKVGGAKK